VVWSAGLLFFQVVLLSGYAWAHWLQRFPVRRQVIAHGVLCLAAFLSVPVIPGAGWKSVAFADRGNARGHSWFALSGAGRNFHPDPDVVWPF
jgi:hypothetical protein